MKYYHKYENFFKESIENQENRGFDFKKTFLNLTDYTIPFGKEDTLEHLLPNGWKKDAIGNYYYEIDNSETLFTSHLDTASKNYEKVNHIINGNIISTDKTTILGGDNKAGCTVLFYLISKGIPGTYYFFLGEESTVHGDYPYGSIHAIEEKPEYFKKFKRIITFDRKEKGSIVNRQLGRVCCSNIFVDNLIKEFYNVGMKFHKDSTGYYTDSAFFVDLIPECVNISVGVWNEHTVNEYVDISYIKDVALAASKINWEGLSTDRKLENNYSIDSRKYVEGSELSNDQLLFQEIFTMFDDLYFVCHEIRSYNNYLQLFKVNRKYHFVKWHEDEEYEVSIYNGLISCNGKEFNTIEDFFTFIGVSKMDVKTFCDLLLKEFEINGGVLSDAKFNYLITLKTQNMEDVKKELENRGIRLEKIGKGYSIKDI